MVQAQSQLETAQAASGSAEPGEPEASRSAARRRRSNAAKAHYENAAVQLSYAKLVSPITGVVADRRVYPGEMAASGTPLISIVDISQVVARANVPVKDATVHQSGHARRASPVPMATFPARSRW